MRKIKKVENTIHHDIFYPSKKDEILNMIEKCETNYKAITKTDSKVFILPHASFEFILPLLVNTFTSIIDNFEKILIVAPSHLKVIDDSSLYNLFTPSYDAIKTAVGILDFDKDIINKYFNENMQKDTYFEEESSFEQLYVLIKHYFPQKKVIPLCAVIENSKQSKDFSTFLNAIIDEKTLVLISSNACAYQKTTIAYEKTNNFINALTCGERLLQLQRKNIIDSCGCGIIDSITKTQLYKNKKFKINLIEVEKKISNSIIKIKTNDKCVYHITATIEDN